MQHDYNHCATVGKKYMFGAKPMARHSRQPKVDTSVYICI